jgi:2'-5' RNA ligase
MLSNLVLAYPKLNREDYNWIQSVRKEYDNRYFNVVEPHFTIVFPLFNYNFKELEKHIANVCDNCKPIQFTIRAASVVKDSFSDYTDVLLVPDEGNSQIIKLHDKFYSGIISTDLRIDIPFIPHIGVGANKNPKESKLLCDKLNNKNICIQGIINELEDSTPKCDRLKIANKNL